MPSNKTFLQKHKYELLLIALIQHLFIGIFLIRLYQYTRVIWTLNMLIVGVASVGIFIEKGRLEKILRIFLFLLVLILPLGLPFAERLPFSQYMQALSLIYFAFFTIILWEIIRFLVRPGYIDIDIISAAACGYLLLIEISVFLMQYMVYHDPASFKNIDASSPVTTFIDLVYFSSIIQTTIGFGDITPNAHYAKLTASFFGIVGQFYSVVLIGILISKFASKSAGK